MTSLKVRVEDLHVAAKEFGEASKESQATLLRMEKAMTTLESKWSGASQQVFYREYKEVKTVMGGMAILLKQIARELTVLADEYKRADSLTGKYA
jgi:WXG100 family type VII secretion target